MTPAARVLGRRLRIGYVVILLTLAGALAGAGSQVRNLLGLDALHAGMINGAGRQRFLSVQAVHRAFLIAHEPSRYPRASVDLALAQWVAQQESVDHYLPRLCPVYGQLCDHFTELKKKHRVVARATVDLLAADAVSPFDDRSAVLQMALNDYVLSADRWVGDFAEQLADFTLSQQRRVLIWSLVLIAATTLVVVLVLEPIIRRLQEERSSLDGAARERTRLAAFAEASHNAVAVTDPQGRIEWVNAGFTRLTGFSPDAAIGKAGLELLQGPDTDPATMAEMTRGVESGNGFHVELLHYKADKQSYWGSLDCRPMIDASGQVTAFIAIESDITEHRRAANELTLAKETAESANAAKGDFLANMSHEIRTPLNGVIGMTGLLLDTDLDSQQREYAEIARSSGEGLLALINDILDFSKIESRHLELESIEFDLRSIIDETVDSVALKASEKRIEILVDVELTCPISYRGDPTRLRQILLNLLSNAVKFTDAGDITLAVGPAPASEGRVALAVSVSDTGIGIPEDRTGKLFAPFTQADASTTRQHGGTGLGLSICRQLIELMGGSISVESRLGGGSVFRFQVVLDSSSTPGTWPRLPLSSPVRALLVDDHPGHLRILSTQLRSWGIQVATAGTAEEALQQWDDLSCDGQTPQIALLDLRLADQDGERLGTRIRARDPSHQCRLVQLTSLTSRLDRGDSGIFDRTITKPVKSDVLYRALSELVGAELLPSGPDATAPNGLEGFHVLLVDDNAVNQKLGERQLTRLGLSVTQAWNGLEALEQLRRRHFDVVLMDCQMPKLDGYEATRLLRRPESGARNPGVPVIAMTAHALSSDRERCLAAGMDGYVTKPIDPKRLLAVLQGVLETRNEALLMGADTPGAEAILDVAALMKTCDEDHDFVRELLHEFLRSASAGAAGIDMAALQQNSPNLRSLAHQLKGAASNIHAGSLAAAAAAMEIADEAQLATSLESFRNAWVATRRHVEHALHRMSQGLSDNRSAAI
ncbi:MAG: two-component system, sensor histidine kinase and response regulator [Gammaproteobacteria bacterium]|nr:two-component system, sensor histidine kinase and response regulator [Gammaproteobacteria bacterium]